MHIQRAKESNEFEITQFKDFPPSIFVVVDCDESREVLRHE